jgi:regulator of sirC expression with transglutaminase-like and TPR domain
MSKIVDFDVSNTWVRGASFDKAVTKIKEAFDFSPNFAPSEIRLYPADHKAIFGQLQRSLNKAARNQAAAEKLASYRKDRVTIEPDRVGIVTFRGIPLTLGYRQSRPRAVTK